MAISWWNILLSMDNMNPHCFGQMELALPQSGEHASIKKPLGNKGLIKGSCIGKKYDQAVFG